MAVTFSKRTSWDLSESSLAGLIRTARAYGRPLLDLTVANPTVCGFTYDPALLDALTNPTALTYDPDPRGLPIARDAVAGYYDGHRADVDPDRVILTTSTSEAYSYLFRLLCNGGDEVLAAQPSYPLFDYLADLEEIHPRAYPVFYDFGWWIDFAELERRITPRTKAILLVHPNNPTGHITGPEERIRLEDVCLRHGLALIVDEVFLDYGLDSQVTSFAVGPHPVLTFVVSGLSKIAGLPQMKVAWLTAFGPETLRAEALARLEVIADTFLSMNAPAQLALPVWLASSEAMQQQILARVRENLRVARASGLAMLKVDAGWSAIVRLPDLHSADEWMFELVQQREVIVHPGSFYGMTERNRVVISLLGPMDTLAEGVQRLIQI